MSQHVSTSNIIWQYLAVHQCSNVANLSGAFSRFSLWIIGPKLPSSLETKSEVSQFSHEPKVHSPPNWGWFTMIYHDLPKLGMVYVTHVICHDLPPDLTYTLAPRPWNHPGTDPMTCWAARLRNRLGSWTEIISRPRIFRRWKGRNHQFSLNIPQSFSINTFGCVRILPSIYIYLIFFSLNAKWISRQVPNVQTNPCSEGWSLTISRKNWVSRLESCCLWPWKIWSSIEIPCRMEQFSKWTRMPFGLA